jgi:transketolase
MRVTFIQTLNELAASDRRVVLLTGDIGFRVLEGFAARHPDRFFNVGVAEQNMIGLATGLAEAGFIPFCYSIVPFAVLRPYEFIRNGPVQHRLPVRIVGVGAGMEYGLNGSSHYGLDDLAVTRAQPGLCVLAPADARQSRGVLLATWDRAGPIYYRLGKDEQAVVPGLDGRFVWDEPTLVRDGRDLLVVTTSSIAHEAAAVVERLGQGGLSAAFAVVAQINPPPAAALAQLMRRFRLVCSVENHFASGGLGTMLAEIAADHGLTCRLKRFGASDNASGRSGSTAFMHRHLGLGADEIEGAIRQAWDQSP